MGVDIHTNVCVEVSRETTWGRENQVTGSGHIRSVTGGLDICLYMCLCVLQGGQDCDVKLEHSFRLSRQENLNATTAL